MKLSAAQQELLDAICNGVKVTWVPYRLGSGNYYFRDDTMKNCTATAKSLVNHGLVEQESTGLRSHVLRAKA